MYVGKSILEGLKILGFDHETIKSVAREKNLEEIFLSTLFLNYIIVLVVFFASLLVGGISIEGKRLNELFFYGVLMVYPFLFNVLMFALYGFFGLMAEMLDKRKHVKPLLSVGFHTGIVYALIFYLIGIMSTIDLRYGVFLIAVFMLYFLYAMFLAISTVYNFSLPQTLIVLFTPFLLISLGLLGVAMITPQYIDQLLLAIFA